MALHCMKCGQKVEESCVFCPDCLAEMEKYPIKPGTVVRLPQRTAAPAAKKRHLSRYSFKHSSDQIEMLRTRTRWLTFALIVTFLCFLAAAFLVMWLLDWHKYFEPSTESLAFLCEKCFT